MPSSCTVGKCRKDQHEVPPSEASERSSRITRARTVFPGHHLLSRKPERVAVIGSIPAGSSSPRTDAPRRARCDRIFEAYHELGGVMRYGIPWNRWLPKIIDHETKRPCHGCGIQDKLHAGETRTPYSFPE